MGIRERHSFDKVLSTYEDLRNERQEWEAEWRTISDFLLPGRGIYQTYSNPRKRKLTTQNIINTIGEDSLNILTSGLHGRLTSPAMPWFRLGWIDDRVVENEQFKAWLQDGDKQLNSQLHKSNFYSVINSFYVEFAGFGTACLYLGEDSDPSDSAFRFELLTAGEYAFSLSADGKLAVFCRTIFMSKRQLVERFGRRVSEQVRREVSENRSGIDKTDLAIIEYVARDQYQDKEFVRFFYEVCSSGKQEVKLYERPLEVSGFYEMPYFVARWGTIGSDVYGIGPGSRAIPDIRRLQEMEKAFLMATHKTINPPLNAPAKMRGKLNTLPGGKNYYSNPQEKIEPIYAVNFDYNGVSAAIERVEQRIQKNFYNDVFLTAMRDPNASPLRTGQVQVQEQEQMFRLGPIVERLGSELFEPMLRRGFKILERKQILQPLAPEARQMAGEFSISMISPLAVAQRKIKAQGTDAFMQFIGAAAQFDQSIIDNVDPDAATRQRADIEGVDLGILRPQAEVAKIREARAKKQAEDEQLAREMAVAEAQGNNQVNSATARKTSAEAGQILVETGQTAREAQLQ